MVNIEMGNEDDNGKRNKIMRIDQSNYQSFLLSCVDGELTEAEGRELEIYCQAHPEAAAELALLRQTVIIPALTVFEDKTSLYREEEKRRTIGWYLWRAAILLVLLTGSFSWWYLLPPEAVTVAGEPVAVASTDAAHRGTEIVVDNAVGSGITGSESGAGEKVAPAGLAKTNAVSAGKGLQRKSRVRTVAGIQGPEKIIPVNTSGKKDEEENSAVADKESGNSGLSGQTMDGRATAAGIDVVKASAPERASVPALSVRDNRAVKEMVSPASRLSANSLPSIQATENLAGETAFAEGNDAVSILRLAKNRVRVGQLFRRFTGSRESEDARENATNKKVNISVFQFALSK